MAGKSRDRVQDAGARREILYEAALYAGAVAVALGGVWWVLRLWSADLRVPLTYWGDALFSGVGVKGTIASGWYLVNKSLGAPGFLDLADYPGFDSLHWATIRILGLFTGDWGLVTNVFYLATYPLCAVSALYALRHLRISRPAAFSAAVLFAFVPYHFYRSEGHLFLSAYYLVPLAVMLAVLLGSNAMPFFRAGEGERPSLRMDLFAPRSIVAALIALAIGLSGLYYAFFACFMFVVGGVLAAIRRRDWRRLAAAGLLIAFVGMPVVAQMVPTWSYLAAAGPNPGAIQRTPAEADLYDLRLTQLVLPIPGHRVEAIDSALKPYRDDLTRLAPSSNGEVSMVTLGLSATIGLLLALGWVLFAKGRMRSGPDGFGGLMDTLSTLDISALLLGTVGGLGAFVGIW